MSGYKESVFRYGANNNGFGVLTQPGATQAAPSQSEYAAGPLPVLVIFNAGLLHRSEPYRLPVEVARSLAAHGFSTLRLDLAGKGDSVARDNRVTNRESVALDWQGIQQGLDQYLGAGQTFVLMGLCSGADNAIKLTFADSHADQRVKAMVLFDPICPRDQWFYGRRIVQKLFRLSALLQLPGYFYGRLTRLLSGAEAGLEEPSLRDLPTDEELRHAVHYAAHKNGVLAIFSSYAYDYYNKEGQFSTVTGLPTDVACEEHLWMEMSHLYALQAHRDKVVACVESWFTKRFL